MRRNLRSYSAIVLAAILLPSAAQAQSHRSSIGPFELVSADSSSRLRLQFAAQTLVSWQDTDHDSAPSQLTTEFRRIRFGLRGSFDKDKTSFYLHLSFAPRSIELMDFYVNRVIGRDYQLRAGQYKIPFTRFRIQSFQRLTFAEWPIVTKFFGAERQIGLTMHNGYETPPKWAYVVGIMSGVNARASHGIGIATVYGEKVPNPSDLVTPGPRAEVHPEAVLHLSYHSKSMRVDSDTDPERGPLRMLAALSAAWDFDPTERQDFTQRLAAEWLTKWRGWSASAIGYAGFAETGDQEENHLAMLAGLFQTAYRINRTWELSARGAIVDHTDDLLADAKSQTDEENQTVRQQEATFGINYYFSDHAFKLQNDAGLIRSTFEHGHQTQYRIRSQLQLAF